MKKFFEENKKNPWFWAFVAAALTLLIAMPMMSTTAGNSGDEDGFQIPQGENVLNYYRTHGEDTTCMSFENLKYYGCSFDVITGWINDTFHVDNIATTRHIFNALCGWLILFFGALIAYRMANWRAAVITLAIMFLSPRLLGHSFNNPKDIPFAAGVTMAIYYMLMFFRQLPKPKWSTAAMLAVSIAFAISIRVGGLILFGYFGLWGILWLIMAPNARKPLAKGQKTASVDWNTVSKAILWAAGISIAGFLASILLWPYAQQGIIKNTIDSYHAMSKFAIAIRQIYEGHMVWSDALPWYYTPKFILTTIPLAVILGAVLYAALGAFRKENRQEGIMLFFCFLFPVAWIAYTKANVYGGWRHSLFAYPTMAVCAALGFEALITLCKEKVKMGWVKYAATVLPFLMLTGPAMHIVKNHPYEYIYFNQLVGGTQKAYGQYEMDYYYHSIRECVEWVKANAEKSDKVINVGTWHMPSTLYFLRNDTTQFRPRFCRWHQQGDYEWDYAVFSLTGMDPDLLRNPKFFPPKNTVHTVEVDGVPIAIVLKREDNNDYLGAQMKKEGKIDSAMTYFRKALQYNPYNESVLSNMSEIYLNTNRFDSVEYCADKILEMEPKNSNAQYFKAYARLLKGDLNSTMALLQEIKKNDFKYGGAYRLAMQIYLQQNNLPAAEQEILAMMDVDQIDNQALQTYIAIQKAGGADDRMAYVNFYKAMIKSLQKRGKKEEAKVYEDYLSQMR